MRWPSPSRRPAAPGSWRSPGGTRAPALASEFGAEAEPSVEALLERADIDAVVISTPHTAHLPNVLAAAAAGKHILLEKPMALSVDECRQMNEACDAAGVKLSLAKISRWLEAVKVGHDLIADGTAGDLVALHVHRLFPGYPNTGWPLDPREGGAWLDWGSHGCDIVRWFAGREPINVGARFVSRRTDMPDLTGFATFEFPDAILANLFMSYEIPATTATERAHYTAIGTEAVIDIHAYGGVDILRGDTREPSTATSGSPTRTRPGTSTRRISGAGSRRRSRTSSAAIEEDRPPTIDGHDGLAAVAMATGAIRSWREDVVVRL